MSGIVGLLNLDGAPIDPVLLRRLTNSLAFRGPDAQEILCDGNVGFGHALLNISLESLPEHQPFSLNAGMGIVADARIDGRVDLIGKLQSHSQDVQKSATDAELILRAYRVWDDACVDHLLGDFAFAIWDAPRRHLFCARDQMGVKPFFYARVGACLAFSNTLKCLLHHPGVDDARNELAIADFLIFELNQNPSATAFAKIQRLPPAHILTCDAGNISIRRYWNLPGADPIQFRRSEDCIEHFTNLLDTAVSDRLRSDTAGVFMSGGLDSPIVAASAQRIFTRAGANPSLRAYTQVFDHLIPHEERRYSSLVAEALGIPIEFLVDDDLQLFGLAAEQNARVPEPANFAWPDKTAGHLRRLAGHSRVALTGFGADPALSSRITVHFRELLKSGQIGRAASDAVRYLASENRLSRLYLRTRWSILFASDDQSPNYPSWLNSDLEKRLGLRERWETIQRATAPPATTRPDAYEALTSPFWASLFEAHDPGWTRVPVEVRHPFFDLRVVQFLLALPALPWCSDKQLLRDAARGTLPDAVRLRRKSPLTSDPLLALLENPEADAGGPLHAGARIGAVRRPEPHSVRLPREGIHTRVDSS